MDSALAADDDWEVINDDGFVYKRKRRRLDPSIPPPPLAADPLEEERHRGERKRRTLLKLKNQYRRELDQWEHLSNTLKAMEEKSLQLQQQREQERDQTASCAASSSGSGKEMDRACGSVVDELLLQVEAQEAMIRDFSNLCDVAEAMCNAEDERLKQSLIDLPIWGSPGELMASLCDEVRKTPLV